MSASALPNTLKSVTATKIGELKKQRRVFEESKAAIGQEVKRRKLDLDKTKALVDGTGRLESFGSSQIATLTTRLPNILDHPRQVG